MSVCEVCGEMLERLKCNYSYSSTDGKIRCWDCLREATGRLIEDFEIGDVVMQDGNETLFVVSGVIHDQGRLFLRYPPFLKKSNGEFEMSFKEVVAHYRRVR